MMVKRLFTNTRALILTYQLNLNNKVISFWVRYFVIYQYTSDFNPITSMPCLSIFSFSPTIMFRVQMKIIVTEQKKKVGPKDWTILSDTNFALMMGQSLSPILRSVG